MRQRASTSSTKPGRFGDEQDVHLQAGQSPQDSQPLSHPPSPPTHMPPFRAHPSMRTPPRALLPVVTHRRRPRAQPGVQSAHEILSSAAYFSTLPVTMTGRAPERGLGTVCYLMRLRVANAESMVQDVCTRKHSLSPTKTGA